MFALVTLSLSLAYPTTAQHSYVIVTPELESAEQKAKVHLHASQRLLVVLSWQATGYRWRVSQYDKAFLDFKELDQNEYGELVNHGILKRNRRSGSEPGSVQQRVFEFLPISLGTTQVELQYIRGFETQPWPAKRLFLTITISDSATK